MSEFIFQNTSSIFALREIEYPTYLALKLNLKFDYEQTKLATNNYFLD